jgi:hypothetical protein
MGYGFVAALLHAASSEIAQATRNIDDAALNSAPRQAMSG